MPDDREDIDTFGKILEYATGWKRLCFPPDFDPAAKDLCTRLLDPEPRDRYGAKDTMAHAFFKGYDFMALEKGKIAPPYVPEVADAFDATHFDEFDEDDEPNDAPSARNTDPTGFT